MNTVFKLNVCYSGNAWTAWTACSVDGFQKRYKPPPSTEVELLVCTPEAEEDDTDLGTFNANTWHTWQAWVECSETCGVGYRFQKRECGVNDWGLNCPGEGLNVEKCVVEDCPGQ